MKILQLEAENVKRLKVVSIKPDGSLVQITGANGEGKSSVLDAIYYALAGTKGIPSEPVRKGAAKAFVRLDLGEFTVTRRFTSEGSTSLTVEAKGTKFSSPQKMLDDLLGELTFDPLEFSRMIPREQLNILRTLVKFDVDIDELERQNKLDFEQRTDVNRNVKQLEAQIGAIELPETLPDKIDLPTVVREMEAASASNVKRAQMESDIARRAQNLEQLETKIVDLRERANTLLAEAERARNEADAVRSLELPEPPASIDLSVFQAKIQKARVIAEIHAKADKKGELQRERDAAEDHSFALTQAIGNRTMKREDAIANADMPVKGLSFDANEVLFNKVPFSQASSAEQLRVSVALAMVANPKLRILRIKDGSLLDSKNLALLTKMADKYDYQIWIERVATDGKVGIVMEDGMVAAAQPVVAAMDRPDEESRLTGD